MEGVARFRFRQVSQMRRHTVFSAMAAICLFGCGGPKETTVTGKVSYQNKPLITGFVLLRFDDNNEVTGTIGIDGTYTIRTPYQGHAKIAVGSPKPPDPAASAGRRASNVDVSTLPDPKNWVPIPDKYLSSETSGLEINVTGGTNAHNIELQ
ncbi:MAG: hypothetical protein ACJ8C4_09190 [Gemmataceae bacterium]